MNSAERLKAIIAERKQWEAFDWGPVLVAWALVLGLRMTVELWTGPRPDLGTGAYLLLLGFQGLLAWAPGAPAGIRQGQMQGFWILIAVIGALLGSWAPALGGLKVTGGAVMELLFLSGGLAIIGLLKSRWSAFIAGVLLGSGAVLLGNFPVLWAWRPVMVALAYGIPGVIALVRDLRPASDS